MTDSEGEASAREIRVVRERDLLLQLLELETHEQTATFLRKALSIFTEAVGACRGYIELQDPVGGDCANPLRLVDGIGEGEGAPSGVSRSMIEEVMATGETIVTASAFTDPRFLERGSVRLNKLEAILCVPIGARPGLGAVYLQERSIPGPFSSEDVRLAKLFAHHVGKIAGRLFATRRQAVERDPTQAIRQRLRAEELIGSSEALASVLQQAALVAPLQVSVLITGESGTGKTQLARVLHENSTRASQRFLEINCGALPENLIESELFGAEKGSHSGAHTRQVGKVEAAEGGTLFLDEIAELSVTAQTKLLQLAQSGSYFAVGGSHPRHANIRLIAATNTDLERAVASKRFREDLYYRLNVFPIRMPSIAERKEDIPELAAHFCRVACETHGLPLLELSPGALSALEHAEWPGNVRELAHLVQRGVVRARGESATHVERTHLFLRSSVPPETRDRPARSFRQATLAFQKEFLLETLRHERWNVAAVARTLDLTRAHVYNLMATLSIERPGSGDAGRL